MGRSYWFECSRCGYRARVSGRTDRGLDFFVQTVLCRDCKALYDAVTRVRVPEAPPVAATKPGLMARKGLRQARPPAAPPTFQAALVRLPHAGFRHFHWQRFKLQCPVSSIHRVEAWGEPYKCPKCGYPLDKNALPFRVWD